MKYNYLDADEAEERFERRDKTLNYFSIMLSKRLKGQQEEGEGPEGEGAGPNERQGVKKLKKLRRKTVEEEEGLVSNGVTHCDVDPLPHSYSSSLMHVYTYMLTVLRYAYGTYRTYGTR